MFPDQQNQHGEPQNPYAQPQTGVNAAPVQAPNGQYAVLPPLPAGQNAGHSGHNPYEFIVNPNTPKRAGFTFGNNFGVRIAMLVGGFVVVLIILAVILSALGPKSITPQLIAITQRQQEIVRIATAASSQASGQDTQDFATNTSLSLTSNQQQLQAYLASHGTKLKAKDLALDASPQTDTLLSSAASAGNYDSVATQTLSDQLKSYENLLQTSYKQTGNANLKALLQSCYSAAAKLLTQAQAINTNSD